MTAGLRAYWSCRQPAGCAAIACARSARVAQDALDRLREGMTIDGVHYGAIEATLDREQGANVWLTFAIREGKNREVRKVLEMLGLKVNRLIRVVVRAVRARRIAEGAVEGDRDRRNCAKISASGSRRRPRRISTRHRRSRSKPRPVILEKQAREPREPRKMTRRRSATTPYRKTGCKPRTRRAANARRAGRDRNGGPRPKRPRPK